MKNLLILSLVLVTAIPTFSETIDQRTEERLQQIQKMWSPQYESTSERIIHAPGRMATGVVDGVASMALWHLLLDIPKSLYNAMIGNEQQAEIQAGNSPLNPLLTANVAISDADHLVRSVVASPLRKSQRIQFCHSNLITALIARHGVKGSLLPAALLLSVLNPTEHVGYLIDETEDSHDPGGGAYMTESSQKEGAASCHSTPVYDNISDSLAIQRLKCLADRDLVPNYNFFITNCATYTTQNLKSAGLWYTGSPNLGIGLWLSNVNQEQIQEATQDCMNQESLTLQFLKDLEVGRLNRRFLDDMREEEELTSDLALQVLVSAARSKKDDIRKEISYRFDYFWESQYFTEDKNIRPEVVSDLLNILVYLDVEDLKWLDSEFDIWQRFLRPLLTTPTHFDGERSYADVFLVDSLRNQSPYQGLVQFYDAKENTANRIQY